MILVGTETYQQFAHRHQLSLQGVRKHMQQGYCKWPRQMGARSRQRTQHPEHATWKNIKKRCYTPTDKGFIHYGSRGIRLDPAWVTDFEAFATYLDTELGPRPEGYQLDRINNDLGYIPGNLQWVDVSTNLRNRRKRTNTGYFGISRNSTGGYRLTIGKYTNSYTTLLDALVVRAQLTFKGYIHG